MSNNTSIEMDYQISYQEKFKDCIKSWIWGLAIGLVVGLILAFTFAGFKFSSTFWGLSPFTIIASMMLMPSVMALKFTEGYGASCIPLAILRLYSSIWSSFSGSSILLVAAVIIICLLMSIFIICLFIFMAIFPWETIYYTIRYLIEKGSAKKDTQPQA